MSSNQLEDNPVNVLKDTWWYKDIIKEINERFIIDKEEDEDFDKELWWEDNLCRYYDTMFHNNKRQCLTNKKYYDIVDDRLELYLFLKEVVSKDNFMNVVIEMEKQDLWEITTTVEGWSEEELSITELLIYYIGSSWYNHPLENKD